MKNPLIRKTVDNSNGILMPFYDHDTRVVFLAGKVSVDSVSTFAFHLIGAFFSVLSLNFCLFLCPRKMGAYSIALVLWHVQKFYKFYAAP